MRRLLHALVFVAPAALAQVQSDWEREHAERLRQSEELVVAPPALERSRLVEVKPQADSEFRYFVDAGSISVGPDRIVRYVMVARSPSGVENVTFQGMRCPREYRIYAVGRADGSWGGRPSTWRPAPPDLRSGERALSDRYFCPGRAAVLTAEEGARALRDGGHAAMVRELRQP